jgi:hypothetical protein
VRRGSPDVLRRTFQPAWRTAATMTNTIATVDIAGV